jgi:hypothetical protein
MQITEKNTGVIARFKYEFGRQDDELRTVQAEKRLLRLYRGAVENGAHLFPSGLINIIACITEDCWAGRYDPRVCWR